MNVWLDVLPWLIAMIVLIGLSAFFSASEAVMFSLKQRERLSLAAGTKTQQLAAALLEDPERLLSTVLFWNLVVNMAYFAAASIVGFRLEKSADAGATVAYAFAASALMSIIFFSEMLPKTIGVLVARPLAGFLGPPLTLAVRVMSPLLPTMQFINLVSRRLIWPTFQEEPYLHVSDLGRAIDLSTSESELEEQERIVLNNIVAMSDIRVDEWMRPRTQFLAFRSPVTWQDLQGQMTPSGYLLITAPESDEVCAALDLLNLSEIPQGNLDKHASPVLYLPWRATVADAYQQLYDQDREVVAVVNEFGATIGILTYEDILDTVFTDNPSRSFRLLHRQSFEEVSEGVWRVSGVAGVRQLARGLGIELPTSRNTTVAGVIQEKLHRVPVAGDVTTWGPVQFRVISVTRRFGVVAELTFRPEDEWLEDES